MSKVIEINDSQFEKEVIKENQTVLAYFWASWCGPCRLVSPSINWVAENYSDRLKVVKLEVDASPETVATYDVKGIPVLILFKQGKMISKNDGSITKEKLKEFIEKNL
ncbi:thioredoxin [Geminocystis sp. NIES-3709]|uniref:thioredoxin n=1 Tax=Geminocystis sp. NIES-3709 TaxID=1617448 RepID=UPI0005FC6279|nr:thioredoxin [Geminocystis sp. NIES-3709]BAQ66683.1 thioredoxin [Geminocystis sp. NIES-3709]